jgi:branched-chain amino acid transport system permease protein
MLNAAVPLVLDSVASAALIFFAAVGLTLVFNVLRVLNVAHGSLYSIGGYVAASICLFISSRQLNPYLSFVALLFSAVAVAAVFGPLIERTLVRWTYGKSEAVQILVTFGLFLALEDLQRMVFGVQSFYEDTPMRLLGTSTIDGVVYLNYQILLVVLALLAVVGLRLLINHTRLGRLITAVVTDREMAQSIGINTNRIFVLAFSIGVFLAALGGAFAAPTSGIAPGLGADTMVLAFAVAAIGGLGQIEGAVVASLIVGLARVLAIYLMPSLDAVAPYAAMLVVLLIRPYGLFGAPLTRRI